VRNLSNNELKFKEKSSQKIAMEKREDFLSNRIMIVFVTLTVLIVTLLLLRKNNNNFEASLITGPLLGIRIGLGVLFAASVGYFAYKKKSHADESFKYFNSSFLLGCAAVLFVVSLVFPYILTLGTVVVLIAALLLYFLYCFYAGDFFAYSVMTAIGSLFIYASSLGVTAGAVKGIVKFAAKGCAVILPVIVIIALFVLRSSNGDIQLKGKRVKIMRPGYNYYPFFVGAVITFAGSLASLFFAPAMLYAQIVLFVAYIVIAIIYTIKMM